MGGYQSNRKGSVSEQDIDGKGGYALVMTLADDRRIRVGKLGTLDFPAGYYVYFGSALGGLKARVNRHLRRKKKRHWHIDSLTATAVVSELWWALDVERRECLWARAALDTIAATVPVVGFGSSDCRCRSHLVHVNTWPEVELLFSAVEPLSPRGLHALRRAV